MSENLLAWTKYDPSSKLTVTSSQITFTNLYRTNVAYVYDDKGVDYFSGYYEVWFAFRCTAKTAGDDGPTLCSLANAVDTYRNIYYVAGGPIHAVHLENPSIPDQLRLHLTEIDPAGSDSVYTTPGLNTWYYCKFIRDETVGTYGKLYLYLYSDPERQTQIGLLQLDLHAKRDFRYIYGVQSYGGTGVYSFSGDTKDFDIFLVGPTVPTVSTFDAVNIEKEQADLPGQLDDDGGQACDCGFEWGETVAYGNTTPTESKTTGQNFSQTITGLDAGKTYHFRAVATNAVGTSYGADKSFVTPAPGAGLNPAVITLIVD